LYCAHFYDFYGVVLFHYFYSEMLCVDRGSRHFRTKSITAGTKSAQFYNLCAALLILRATANSARRITEFGHP